MAEVRLPRSLAALFPGLPSRVAVEGVSVAAVIDALNARWPGIRERLCDTGPVIREHINVFVDGEPADLESAVRPTSVVHIIPAISGGSGGSIRRATA